MRTRTLKALRDSIEHWRRMANGVEYEMPTWTNCPLCQLFNTAKHNNSTMCRGCPVMKRTGETGCRKTPYKAASDRWDLLGPWGAPKDPVFRQLAEKELEFLESLLPKTKTKKGKTCKKK